MRRRILTVALSAAVLAVVLLGVPLGFAIHRNAVIQERGELERAALEAAVVVSPTYLTGDPVELPAGDSDQELGLYDRSGRRVAGAGPADLEDDLQGAVQGSVREGGTDSAYVEAVPVSVDEHVIGIVRTSAPKAAVRATVVHQLLLLSGLAVVTLIGAGGFAFVLSRRLGRLMRELADAAAQLGAGDLPVNPRPSGVPEIDRTRAALVATAGQIADQRTREREFSAQASHQLRTPLTRLRLELEAGLAGPPHDLAGAAQEALLTAEHLSQTVEDVLVLSRQAPTRGSVIDVEPLLTDLVARWQGTFASADRPVRLHLDSPPATAASEMAVRQVVHVLLDNAWRHGAGKVTVTARGSAGVLAIDVTDTGRSDVTWPTGQGTQSQMGLALARSLAEAQGGRLILASDEQSTRFTLLVPGQAG